MADSRVRSKESGSSSEAPVLRPGRPADPGQSAPAPAQPVAPAVDKAVDDETTSEATSMPQTASSPASSGEVPTEAPKVSSEPPSGDGDEAFEKRFAESRQRRLRRLLRQCERVNLMDFNILSLSGWPDNYSLNAARRRRDSWLLSATIAALVFLSGMTGFVPAWIAGGGFGAFVVILLLGVPFIRRLYSSRASYLDLVLYRQQLLRDARRHIEHLEGDVGLIWQCNELSEFNPTLASPRFSGLKHLSEQRRLSRSLTKREHIRLYLIFLLEAEKAYEKMQASYFEGHQHAIDRGWEEVAKTTTESESENPEQAPAETARKPSAGDGVEKPEGGEDT